MPESLFKQKSLKPATLSKLALAQVSSYEFCENSKNTFFTGHLWTTASETMLKGEKVQKYSVWNSMKNSLLLLVSLRMNENSKHGLVLEKNGKIIPYVLPC